MTKSITLLENVKSQLTTQMNVIKITYRDMKWSIT
jgi:hypothetical protein